MTLTRISLLRWVKTLKFKIMAIAVVTGVVSAVGTTHIVLTKTQAEIERLLLRNDADDSERTASLLANKLEMLQLGLGAVARQATPEKWHDRDSMTRYLVDKPAINALFDRPLFRRGREHRPGAGGRELRHGRRRAARRGRGVLRGQEAGPQLRGGAWQRAGGRGGRHRRCEATGQGRELLVDLSAGSSGCLGDSAQPGPVASHLRAHLRRRGATQHTARVQ